MMAQTVDGKIAKEKNQLANWTSSEDKTEFIRQTKKHGVIIMGETTFQTIGKALPGRLNLILTKNPSYYSKIKKDGLLEFLSASPKEVCKYLSKKGYKSAILGGGAYTNAQFLEADLVDEIILTTEGILFGAGFGFCEGLKKDVKLELKELRKLSQKTFIARYKVIK